MTSCTHCGERPSLDDIAEMKDGYVRWLRAIADTIWWLWRTNKLFMIWNLFSNFLFTYVHAERWDVINESLFNFEYVRGWSHVMSYFMNELAHFFLLSPNSQFYRHKTLLCILVVTLPLNYHASSSCSWWTQWVQWYSVIIVKPQVSPLCFAMPCGLLWGSQGLSVLNPGSPWRGSLLGSGCLHSPWLWGFCEPHCHVGDLAGVPGNVDVVVVQTAALTCINIIISLGN